VPLFDFDGTLVDSDVALTEPWTALGVDPARVPLGLPLVEACARAGVSVDAYLELYDGTVIEPFAGVPELLAALPRWGLASNKERTSGQRELMRLGWSPEAALFSDDFGGEGKNLAPLMAALAVEPEGVVYVGDTHHDRRCARDAGVTFALAGWNPRAAPEGDELVLAHPEDLLDIL
jgi:phosphoglycolate phosphatase-like HAD superfamily hydrolase